METQEKVKHLLRRIYGEPTAARAWASIMPLLDRFSAKRGKPSSASDFSQRDVVLITYGDSLLKPGEAPLVTLRRFAQTHLQGAVSTIHILPFFPYSSDDGFSVMDFLAVNPELGTWQDVAAIAQDFGLMFDYVVNHFSSKGRWFENYLSERQGFESFAIEVDPSADLSGVIRPRSLPLLTEYRKHSGQSVHLWTTFSADQIDFNFKSLDVLQKMIEVLLCYIEKGATILRLDAIAYLWKEIGTSCIHLPQTHDMVKLLRALLDLIAPEVMILTETNVPHSENLSYFGDGRDEAQMVYNFSLPPLLLYSFFKEDVRLLAEWAAGLQLASEHTAFLNFTASHDGIGIRPLEGILPKAAIDEMMALVKRNGGQVSYKRNPDGSDSPYELNISYVDAIIGDTQTGRADKFLASQAIQYALPGVPATYIHSLLGSRNWQEGVKLTGRARTVNRQKLEADAVISALGDSASFRAKVFYAYRHLIKTRSRQSAFHPKAGFEIMDVDPRVFAIRRQDDRQMIWALTNVSSDSVALELSDTLPKGPLVDLLSGRRFDPAGGVLKPYQYLWLDATSGSSYRKSG